MVFLKSHFPPPTHENNTIISVVSTSCKDLGAQFSLATSSVFYQKVFSKSS